MTKSIWTKTAQIPAFDKLHGNVKTDVLIIGGGMCGILCAYFLKKKNIDYILVEGEKIGCGITKNTTAKITSQHGLIYNKLISSAGKETAKMYLEINEKAIEKYRKISENINCDFEIKDAYTYSLDNKEKIENEIKALNSIGFCAELTDNPNLPFKTAGAVKFPNQAQFHPLKFIAETASELNIYEHTYIKDISANTAVFDTGKIHAKKIIVTTHFPFINKHGAYFMKMYQQRSYVSAFENADNLNGMYIDEAQNGMSFKNYKDLLIIGGSSHRTGKNKKGWHEIRDFAQKHYSKSKEKYHWATQDCITIDNIPYIGCYSKKTPNLYVAAGFNKWGMTSSMVSAMILSDIVIDKSNDFQKIFSPQRNVIKPQLFVNGFESVSNMLVPTKKRCPHLGCALKWNKHEHTWDCPCHGSRFEENGELIDNPATRGAKIE